MKQRLAEIFKTKTCDEWCALMEGTDTCFAPVLNMDEAPSHPHNLARQTFVERDGYTQPAPAPRFSRTEAEIQHSAVLAETLRDWGLSETELSAQSD